jgi:Holliday junction resolvasome RuvABC ATP-dependent DNA helicase subunit
MLEKPESVEASLRPNISSHFLMKESSKNKLKTIIKQADEQGEKHTAI